MTNPPPGTLWRSTRFVLGLGARWFHGLKVEGPPPAPGEGGLIIASNHVSGADPILIQSAVKFPISWMMAAEYYNQPALRPFCRFGGAIPVRRGRFDADAVRAATAVLSRGGVLGMFPQGGIRAEGDPLELKPGTAVLALKANCPIVPCRLRGRMAGREMLGAFLLPASARLCWGPPLLPGGDSEESLTQRLAEAIAKL